MADKKTPLFPIKINASGTGTVKNPEPTNQQPDKEG